MDQRESDPRIYIVTLLFLSCILSGGVLLGLYLLNSDPNPLFLQAGMVFVGVPWLFWFLAYLYSCLLKPCTVSVTKRVAANFDPEKGEAKDKNTPETPPPATNSPKEGEKKVQFGDVVVLGDEEKEGSSNNLIQNHPKTEDDDDQENTNYDSRSDNDDDDDDESSVDAECDRTPLRLSVGNK